MYSDDAERGTRPASEEDMEALDALEGDDYGTIRPSECREAAVLFDTIAELFDDIPDDDVPQMARAYHEASIDMLSVMANVMNTMATSGPLGVMIYADTLDVVTEHINEIHERGRMMCGTLWTEYMSDLLFQEEDEAQ